MKNLIDLNAWQALSQHHKSMANFAMKDAFQADQERSNRYSISVDELLFDYSHNRINDSTLNHLFALAEEVNLSQRIKAQFAGETVNITENRPALHPALRSSTSLYADEVTTERKRLYHFANSIHDGSLTGHTGKPFKHIVNIGMGGSYLGPLLCTQALKDFRVGSLSFHFLSTVDPDQMRDIFSLIDPESTLFIISSKTFTTLETITNARAAIQWLKQHIGEQGYQRHLTAVTSSVEKAIAFGIPTEQIFTFWNWVGGRYSIWSAIGLPLVLLIGSQQFQEFLDGAKAMDHHFLNARLSQNIPVIMGLLGIWYINFFNAHSHAVLPYSYRLRSLPAYIQQLDMESNGKSINQRGESISYQTGPIVFGDEGCSSQHSFYQLLHQGKHFTPLDFILIARSHQACNAAQHDAVLASALSQTYAFTHGKSFAEAKAELLMQGHSPESAEVMANHLVISGNKPCNLFVIDNLNPHNLGMLLAAYEHKIFVQSVIWNINPFDQWGVELGKANLSAILNLFTDSQSSFDDATTMQLITRLQKIKDTA